jgi:hypothetical protein
MIAATANPLSAPLTVAAAAEARGAMAGDGFAGDFAALAGAGAALGAADGSFWVEPAAPPAAAGAAAAGFAAAAADGAGILTVGAAVGFGGRLILTVSFLGCTLPLSTGAAPPSGFCCSSAITLISKTLKETNLAEKHCQCPFATEADLMSESFSVSLSKFKGFAM